MAYKYKTVKDLSLDEYEELRSSYYFQALDEGTLPSFVMTEEDVSEELLCSAYGGTLFCYKDFFCNL